MKAILVPVDFSENATNALHYAVEIAKVSEASITLFNSFHVAITASLATTPPSDYIESMIQERSESHQKRLYTLVDKYITGQRYTKTGKPIEAECITLQGVAAEQIEELSLSNQYDLIVMGTKGVSGAAEVLWGSIASHTVRHAKIPVLVVPEHTKAFTLNKMVYATNFDKRDIWAIDYLRDFSNAFSSEITCLHISDSSRKDASDMDRLKSLEAHYWFTPVNKMNFELVKEHSVEKGLKQYFEENKIDLIAVMPQEKSFIERLFSKSMSEKLAMHSSIPLLVIKNEG